MKQSCFILQNYIKIVRVLRKKKTFFKEEVRNLIILLKLLIIGTKIASSKVRNRVKEIITKIDFGVLFVVIIKTSFYEEEKSSGGKLHVAEATRTLQQVSFAGEK